MDVRLPDGTIVTDVPDGTTQSELIARVAKTRPSAAQQVENDQISREAKANLGVSTADLISANPMTQVLTAAARPILGGAKLLEKLFGGTGAADTIKTLDEMQARGNKALYPDVPVGGVAALAGGLLSPISAGAMALPKAASYLGNVAQGAGLGASYGLTAGGEHPMTDAGTGAVIGGGLNAVTQPVSALAGKAWRGGRNLLDMVLPGGTERTAGRIANDVAGGSKQQIIDALTQHSDPIPGSVATAGEAAVPAGRAEFAALQQMVAGKRPSEYDAIAQASKAGRMGELQGVKPDLAQSVKTRAENAAENYGPIMGDKITPTSDTQLMTDAIKAKRESMVSALQDQWYFKNSAVQNENRAANFTPVEGMPRVAGRVSVFPERQAEHALAATDTEQFLQARIKEKSFLTDVMDNLKQTIGLSDKSLSDFTSRPSMQRAVAEAENSARETGKYFPSKQGDKFSLENLQTVKEALDESIKTKVVGGLTESDKSVRDIAGTRDQFIKWLSERHHGWKDARLQYHEDSIPINQSRIISALEDKLQNPAGSESALSYLRVLDQPGNEIRKATGFKRYNELSQVLNPNQVSAAERVASEMERNTRVKEMASIGMEHARDIVGKNAHEVPPTGMFSPILSVARGIVNRMGGKADQVTMELLSKVMQDPKATAQLMQAATPKEQSMLIQAIQQLRNPALIGVPATAAAQGAQ